MFTEPQKYLSSKICSNIKLKCYYLFKSSSIIYTWNIKDKFSLSINSSINKLTSYYNTTAKNQLVYFYWSVFLRPVRHPQVLGCSLNATGWIAYATTLLTIAIRYRLDLAIFCDILSAMGSYSRPFCLENISASL